MARAQRVLEYIQKNFRENPAIEVGDRVYHVGDAPIAKGGMGLVYAVTVTQNTTFPFQVYDRKKRLYEVQEPLTKAVLKIPFADQEFARAAIKTEREALERPAHPNVVRLLEVIPIDAGDGETTDGLILERLLPSPPELLAKGPLEQRKGCDAASSVEMVANLLKALNTIHYHKRIYLCDIKPLNILLRVGFEVEDKNTNSRQEYVRRLANGELQWAFIDLGISVPRAAVNSKTKSFIGSTEYSPPEAVLEFFLSEKRDVYSLAATFAEMLTGKKPYLDALLEAKRDFKTMMDEAATAEEKQKVLALRGQLAFQYVRKYMKEGKPAYNVDTVLEGFLRSPECSKSTPQELEMMTESLRSFFTEGLNPDPKERATADRLFQILRDPFALSARATDSFLDDFFKLRFRQNVLPFASEIVSTEENEASFHYRHVPVEKFDGFFDLPTNRSSWSGSGLEQAEQQDFGSETLGPLFNTYVDAPLPKAGKKAGRRGLSQSFDHVPDMAGAFGAATPLATPGPGAAQGQFSNQAPSSEPQSGATDYDEDDDFMDGLVSMAPTASDGSADTPNSPVMQGAPNNPPPNRPRPQTMRRPRPGPPGPGNSPGPRGRGDPGRPETGRFRRGPNTQRLGPGGQIPSGPIPNGPPGGQRPLGPPRGPGRGPRPGSSPVNKPVRAPGPPGAPGPRRTGRMGPPSGPMPRTGRFRRPTNAPPGRAASGEMPRGAGRRPPGPNTQKLPRQPGPPGGPPRSTGRMPRPPGPPPGPPKRPA